MKLCVVIPVYNVEKYLRQCIDSILNQSYKPSEIVLVDDGSIDNSPAICDEYANKYEFIKVVHKSNEGLGFARNTGIENCTTDFVTFFDSDDFADSNYLEMLMKPIVNNGADSCKTSYKKTDLYGNVIKYENIEAGIYVKNEVKEFFLPRLIGSSPEKKDSIPMSSCGTIYSMEVINSSKLRFVSERIWISEDTLFNIEYFAKAQNVYVLEYIGYNYRTNPNSLTTKYMPDRFEKCKKMYLKEQEMLSELKIYDLTENRLKRQFFNYLRMCFKQLNLNICGLTKKDSVSKIASICSDTIVREIINTYPLYKLGIKQTIFIFLIKLKCAHIIQFLYDKNIVA